MEKPDNRTGEKVDKKLTQRYSLFTFIILKGDET